MDGGAESLTAGARRASGLSGCPEVRMHRTTLPGFDRPLGTRRASISAGARGTFMARLPAAV